MTGSADSRPLLTGQPAALPAPAVELEPGALQRLFAGFCRVFLTVGCGLEPQPDTAPAAGPFLVCTNHRSHIDSLAVMAALGLPFHRCGLLAAEDYFFRERRRLQLLSSLLHLIPVQRRPTRGGFDRMVEDSRRFIEAGGRMLLAFPEGTRRREPGMAPFKRGPALLALTLGLPILPGHLSGADGVLPKGRALPRPRPIEARFGRILGPEAVAPERPLRERSAALIALVEEQVRLAAAPRGGSLP